jgi:hypothetical protein
VFFIDFTLDLNYNKNKEKRFKDRITAKEVKA